jgi:hypothetical protein
LPPSQIATSQKSRCTSRPMLRPSILAAPLSRVVRCESKTSGHTTLTDSCSRHTRASRRGGHGNCRARSSSLQRAACPLRVISDEPHVPVARP